MESCKCIEPCKRILYETTLSYAALSGLSVNQILTSDLDLLDQKNKAALEIKKRTLPNIFVSELEEISDLSDAYKNLLTTVKHEAWDNEISIFKTVDKALCLFISDVIKSDITNSIMERHADYKETFESVYGRLRRTVQWHLQMLPVEFDIFIRELDSGMAKEKSLNESIPRITAMLDKLGEAIKVYYNAASSSISVYTSPGLDLAFNLSDQLPENVNIGNDTCAEKVLVLTKTSIPLIKAAMRESLGNNFKISHLFDMLLELETDMEYVNKCLNDYIIFLQETEEEEKQILDMLQVHESNLILCPESSTVNDILDYIDETVNIRELSEKIENITQKMTGEATNTLIAETFNEEAIIEASVQLENFVTRLETRLIERSRLKITQLKRDMVQVYLKILRSELRHSR